MIEIPADPQQWLSSFKSRQTMLLMTELSSPQSKDQKALLQHLVNALVQRKATFWRVEELYQRMTYREILRSEFLDQTELTKLRKLIPKWFVLPSGYWRPEFHWMLSEQDHERILTWFLIAKRFGLDSFITLQIARHSY